MVSILPMTHNVTWERLHELNEEVARTLIPAMVYVGVTMLFGIFGNALVCFVFITKMKRGTQNFLITCLAVFDLLSSLLAMPVEITDMRFYYTFPSDIVCKFSRFVNSFLAVSSICTLMSIAVDRYLKVCRPLNVQMQLREGKISVGVAVITGLIFSWPTAVIYGLRPVETQTHGIMGKNCNSLDGSLYLWYHFILAIAFVAFTTALAVLYGLVGMAAKRHKRYMRKMSVDVRISASGRNASVTSLESSTCEVRLSDMENTQTQSLPHVQSLSPSESHSYVKAPKQQKPKSAQSFKNKTTLIGFTVTLVFVVSFLPFISLMAVGAFAKSFDNHLKPAPLVAYNVFVRSYFINSAANPFIYGVLNIRFRKESVRLMRKMLCCLNLISPSGRQAA